MFIEKLKELSESTSDILIIDSHKSTYRKPCDNLHWTNAYILSQTLNADLIWSYKGVNDQIKSGYKKIIFNHSSHYSYVDYKWLEMNPDAEVYLVINDYNLGEPRALWMGIKKGLRYNAIVNHEASCSKLVKKYAKSWNIVNLNSLIFDETIMESPCEKKIDEAVYWGSYRRDREMYFKKYITPQTILSTHSKNAQKFLDVCKPARIVKRIDWSCDGLSDYKKTLYIEDKTTNTNYSCLANRFYESINYWCMPVFTDECSNTIHMAMKSGYRSFVSIDHPDMDDEVSNEIIRGYRKVAGEEKLEVLNTIKQIIGG